MPRLPKQEEIKVRVTAEMKRRVVELAAAKNEGESVIVREALTLYLSRHDARADGLRAVLGPLVGDDELPSAKVAEDAPLTHPSKHNSDLEKAELRRISGILNREQRRKDRALHEAKKAGSTKVSGASAE